MTIKQLIILRTINVGFLALSFVFVGILNSIYEKEFENGKTETKNKRTENVSQEINSEK